VKDHSLPGRLMNTPGGTPAIVLCHVHRHQHTGRTYRGFYTIRLG
jgi:hypothetical protein